MGRWGGGQLSWGGVPTERDKGMRGRRKTGVGEGGLEGSGYLHTLTAPR